MNSSHTCGKTVTNGCFIRWMIIWRACLRLRLALRAPLAKIGHDWLVCGTTWANTLLPSSR